MRRCQSHRQTMGLFTIRLWERKKNVRTTNFGAGTYVSFIMRMWHGVIGVVMLSCTVQFVLAVPGFAQSHNGYRAMVAVDHTALGALRQYVPEPKAEILPVEIPWNLQLPRGYRELVESMFSGRPPSDASAGGSRTHVTSR